MPEVADHHGGPVLVLVSDVVEVLSCPINKNNKVL